MDPGRQAMISRSRSPSSNIVAPRRDRNYRITKPNKPVGVGPKFNDFQSSRTNESLEDEQTRKWVLEEDNFVLKQAKKKAEIRVREGRAKPIDWLAVILRVIDPDRDLLDDNEEEIQHEGGDPENVFEGLNEAQLAELNQDISSYLALEKNPTNLEYWKTMQIICNDRSQKLNPLENERRIVGSVASDVEKLLSPKTLEQLEALEIKIRAKLKSNEPIDIDYWNQLLRSLLLMKARAKLKKVYQSVLDARLDSLHKKHIEDAEKAQSKMLSLLTAAALPDNSQNECNSTGLAHTYYQPPFPYSRKYDPESALKLNPSDKIIGVVEETHFIQKLVAERQKVLKMGYVPLRQPVAERSATIGSKLTPASTTHPGAQRNSIPVIDDFSQTTKALYEREAARGVDEDEEIFTGEEAVTTVFKPQWADKFRPRKPRYFNRVQMGYEWNKYNQTHYDHDNPPPKVVQGYKFNIFYPDLIDRTKAPTFKIIRENGRKRGMSFAPAGEEDTCLIRFIAGPPYEDIAFRIVDKEWDYSAKVDRGFRSSFDKGILQLHFQYKKIYYRK
ncbi:hypothetical protein K3495_g11125 [Podosphaera aphanis]|nr:hypothetical protein K3495_g11125 [Podosphaera aphanis]